MDSSSDKGANTVMFNEGQKIEVLETENTRKFSIYGHTGLIETVRGEVFYVLVYDLDGGLCGPFALSENDMKPIEKAKK